MRLAFVHTPKTGGTSITRVLRERYKLLELNTPDQIKAFLAMSDGARNESDIAVGHMPFGIHRYLPKVKLATFVRNPVDRVISDYFYVHGAESHPMHSRVRSMTLRQYVESDLTFMNDNGMTRRFADYDWREVYEPPFWWQRVPVGRVTSQMLAQAKENLAHCDFVGFYENIEADAARMLRMVDIETGSPLPRENVSVGRLRPEDVDKETLKLVESYNEMDAELYAFARRLVA